MAMSIEQADVVDAISLDEKTGCVMLSIFDHLDWLNEEYEHVFMLQEKLNKYLAFIESGEISGAYPASKDRCIMIEIVAKYPMSSNAEEFFGKARDIVEGAGFALTFKFSE